MAAHAADIRVGKDDGMTPAGAVKGARMEAPTWRMTTVAVLGMEKEIRGGDQQGTVEEPAGD